nr:ribonuclease H-like domain-containing protein [Tanacetum cinerariifolium]
RLLVQGNAAAGLFGQKKKEFGDSYKAPPEETDKGPASERSAKKKGRTVAITTEDMQERRNDVKARTTLLLALPDEHQSSKEFRINSQNLAFISSSNTSSGKGEVHTGSVPTASIQVSTASTDVAAASLSHDTVCTYIATQSNGSQNKYEDITQIDEDDIEEMDIKWNMALLRMRADRFWKKTDKKITIQGSHVAGFDKSKVECFNCHIIGHFARECRAPRSQDRGKRESYKQGPKEEEPSPKALIAIDGIGWDWSYMANEEENHAFVADDEVPTEFALMAKSSSSSDKEVHDDSYCSKSCRKNTKNLNTKISKLNEELSDCEIDLYNYKRSLSQVEARLVEFKEHEAKYCERTRILERDVEIRDNRIEYLKNELEQVKKEKESLDNKLTSFENALKDLDNLLGSQRSDKNKEGLDIMQPTPSIDASKCKKSELQSSKFSAFEHGESSDSIMTPRQHNMYFIDLNNIVPYKNLTCLVAKASVDESMLWHRRLGHLNFKTINKLVRNNLVKGLPSKYFENDHTCVACLKGKQHKASCKTKLVNSVSKPLHTLHMDLFRPTSVSSLNHKWYCLVVTDDCSRFTLTFFLRTKDETCSILSNFITEIESLKDLKLAFCDYHNMVAILEKIEHNTDFHQIVDFFEASHIRIETTNQETKILATVDGKPCTISESSLRRHLKLNDEEGISSLSDTELFENLSLMGYNILPNQSPKSTGFNEFSTNIATAVVCLATNRVYNFSKMIFDGMVRNINTPTETLTPRRYTRRAIRIAQSKALSPAADQTASLSKDDRQREAFPTVSSLGAGQDKENIAKTSTLPHESSSRVPSLGVDEGREELKAEKSTKLGSNDIEEMVNVLSSMEAANILSSGGAAASVSPVDVFPAAGVPTVSAIFTTASVVDREMEEEFTRENQRLNKQLARDSEIVRLHAEEELTIMIKGLDRSNEVISKHLSEYERAKADLSVREKIELIRELIDQGSLKRMKISKGASEEELKGMMQLVPLEEAYIKALQQFDREDLHQLWTLVKETFNTKQATRDKEKEL